MTLLLILAGHAQAGDTSPGDDLESRAAGCHALLTEPECAAHLNTMAMLPAGVERLRYLRAHLETRLEREGLCACGATNQAITYYPAGRLGILPN